MMVVLPSSIMSFTQRRGKGMAIQIHILASGDLALLQGVAEEVFDDAIVPAQAEAFLADDRHHLVVACDGGQIVGFVSAVDYLHPDKPAPELWINEVGVAPNYQGQGIGKQLIAATLELGRSLGCSGAWVLTDRGNLPAMALYQGSGGQETLPDSVMFSFDLK
jgi:GNAT superfamily N-acetyltransferase